MYHDNPSSRSPGSQRNQQQPLNRQPSRQFDAYGPMPSNLYEDPLARYDNNRVERLSPLPSNTHYNYDMPGSQTWNPNGFSGAHSLSSMNSATGRIKPTTRRTGLPSTWLDQQPVSQPQPQQQQQPAPTNHFGGSLAPGQPTGQHAGQHTSSHAGNPTNTQQDGEDELIPTAIVIKNIPFAVKKEQLVQLMTDMNLPLPYAFNYHFDNGVFRGLAFANFTTAEETATVIEVLNHFELQGRKLRVEYKKMLPLQERERIEREKRERRGQLEEQHRPMAASQLQHNTLSHAPATSPSPVSNRNSKLEVDLNDSQTLQFYNELLLFKEDPKREVLIFPPTLTPLQRRTVHTLAHNMGLFHASRGTGDQRQVHVFRVPPDSISPPLSSVPSTVQAADAQRRGLNRAATIDFGEARSDNPAHYGTMRGHNSAFLGVMDSANGFANSQNLRAAKSFADLRSYTPSPVPSSASFPATLQSNGNRLQQPFDGTTSAASNTPTLTPTPSGSSLGMPQRDENLLVNNLGSLSLGTGLGPSGSPRRLRGMFSWEQQQQQQQPQQQQQQQQDGQSMSPGAIGSNRPIGVGFDSQPQERLPLRQPRGPAPDRGAGFRRQNGHQSRGSEELRTNSGVEIIVE